MDSNMEGGEERESELDFQLRRCFIMLWLLGNHWQRSGTATRLGGKSAGVTLPLLGQKKKRKETALK